MSRVAAVYCRGFVSIWLGEGVNGSIRREGLVLRSIMLSEGRDSVSNIRPSVCALTFYFLFRLLTLGCLFCTLTERKKKEKVHG